MRINTQRGIAPLAAFIIALLVIGAGAYGVKKVAEKRKAKTETPAAATGMPVPGTDTKETEVMEKVTTLQVKLNEQTASGQSGQAVITQIGLPAPAAGGQAGTSTLKVIVNITGLPAATSAAQAGKPSGVAQPAHIHIGSCPNPGAVKYPLTSVDKGASQTEIQNLTIEQLLSELPLAVNVHKSAAEAKVYVACGNIEKKETGMMKKDDAMMEKKDGTMMKGAEKMMEKKDSGMMKDAGTMMEQGGMMKKETRVTYTAGGFSPKTITIKKGETVVFENKTGKAASIASDPHPVHTNYPEFDQWKTAERGKTEFRFTFEKVGTWNYHDHLNSTMTGTVVVTE